MSRHGLMVDLRGTEEQSIEHGRGSHQGEIQLSTEYMDPEGRSMEIGHGGLDAFITGYLFYFCLCSVRGPFSHLGCW